MKKNLAINFVASFAALILVSCASCKKNGGVELKGYIRSMSADSFAHYVLECDDGAQYRLIYDKDSGIEENDAGANSGYKVLVKGKQKNKSLVVQKIERVK